MMNHALPGFILLFDGIGRLRGETDREFPELLTLSKLRVTFPGHVRGETSKLAFQDEVILSE